VHAPSGKGEALSVRECVTPPRDVQTHERTPVEERTLGKTAATSGRGSAPPSTRSAAPAARDGADTLAAGIEPGGSHSRSASSDMQVTAPR
jgi:hypothetical protein